MSARDWWQGWSRRSRGYDRLCSPRKLLDFGLARVVSGSTGQALESSSGVRLEHSTTPVSSVAGRTRLAGTPVYLSPEAIDGHPPDEAFDLWALGVVFVECLTGQPPFSADSLSGLRETQRRLDRRTLNAGRAHVPPPLGACACRLLDGDRRQRPATTAEVRDDLRRLAEYRFSGKRNVLLRSAFRLRPQSPLVAARCRCQRGLDGVPMAPTPGSSSVLVFRPAPLVPRAAGRPPTPKPETVRNRLDSWKELAGHLRRTARTVERWERLFGLPVHRHAHARGSSVYAYATELDRWWTERGAAHAVEDEGPSGTSVLWEHVQCIDGVNLRLQVRLRMVGGVAAAEVRNRALEQALAAAGESMVTQVQRRLAGLPD